MVGDGERPALDFIRLEFPGAGASRQNLQVRQLPFVFYNRPRFDLLEQGDSFWFWLDPQFIG